MSDPTEGVPGPLKSTDDAEMVDVDTGELFKAPDCEECRALTAKLATANEMIAALERDLRAKRGQITRLRASKEAELKNDPLWPQAQGLHQLWKAYSGRRRALDWGEIESMYAAIRKLGFATAVRAVAGIVHDPFISKPNKNGKSTVHNSLELAFRSHAKTETYADRAPLTRKDGSPWEPDTSAMAEIMGVEEAKVEDWMARKHG